MTRIKLTAKQVRVIQLLLEGYTITEIAKEMGFTKRSVKAHLSRIYLKFGISNRYVKHVRLIHLINNPEKTFTEEPRRKYVRHEKLVHNATIQ